MSLNPPLLLHSHIAAEQILLLLEKYDIDMLFLYGNAVNLIDELQNKSALAPEVQELLQYLSQHSRNFFFCTTSARNRSLAIENINKQYFIESSLMHFYEYFLAAGRFWNGEDLLSQAFFQIQNPGLTKKIFFDPELQIYKIKIFNNLNNELDTIETLEFAYMGASLGMKICLDLDMASTDMPPLSEKILGMLSAANLYDIERIIGDEEIIFQISNHANAFDKS